MVRRALRSRVGRATVAVAAVVLLASCGGSSAGSGTGVPSSAGTTAAASAPAAGTPASAPAILQFAAPLVSGGSLDGTTFTGKPVAFWFWAPW